MLAIGGSKYKGIKETKEEQARNGYSIFTILGCIDIGLEEDTAIYVTKGSQFKVLGSGLVTVVEGMDITATNIYEIGTGEPFTVRNMRVH